MQILLKCSLPARVGIILEKRHCVWIHLRANKSKTNFIHPIKFQHFWFPLKYSRKDVICKHFQSN